MERYYEYSENKEECRHGLQSIESCKRCLFEALCHYEKMKKENNVE